MINVHSVALNTSIQIERLIGKIEGKLPGPTLLFMGGIHGNEPAGVFALKKVMEYLKPDNVAGNIYAIAGNLSALRNSERFNEADLNRLWTKEQMDTLPEKTTEAENLDIAEQIEINSIIKDILTTEDGPFYFFDLHTTSSETLPFLTVNDSLLNRAFTRQYPLPIILGIEEYLDGPILSYINELGYVAFGFEAGQHDDMASIENCIAFILLTLIFTGSIKKDQIDYYKHFEILAKTTGGTTELFEIYYRYLIANDEQFEMLPGFYNFQKIKEGQHLANSDGKAIQAKKDARIFMPLYQAQGSDGFFTIKKIWKPFLGASAFIRKHRLDRILVFLPGVKWIDSEKSGLLVNKNIAQFMAREVFHLFGYRSVYVDDKHYKMYNREAAARFEEYSEADWMN